MTTSDVDHTIPINMYETDGALVIVAPVPGVMPEDVTVSMHDGAIEMRAEVRSSARRDYLRHEWDYGGWCRVESIPSGFGAPVTATMGNGQLVLSLSRGGTAPSDPIRVESRR